MTLILPWQDIRKQARELISSTQRTLAEISVRYQARELLIGARRALADMDTPLAMLAALCAVGVAGGSALAFLRWARRPARFKPESGVVPAFHKLLLDQRKSMPKPSRPEGERPLAPVVQVVLTGGPMGGKATCAARLRRELAALGWRVIIAPSVAAILGNSGVEIPSSEDVSELLQFEGAVLEMQHALEGSFKRASAACGERSVIIYDRGILDPAAFVPRSQWPALAESAPQLSGRPMSWYTCIMHLVTAADGARSVFETQVRHEHKESSAYSSKAAIEQAVGSAVEEALRIDAAIAEVQGSHPAYIRIDKYAPKATRTRAP